MITTLLLPTLNFSYYFNVIVRYYKCNCKISKTLFFNIFIQGIFVCGTHLILKWKRKKALKSLLQFYLKINTFPFLSVLHFSPSEMVTNYWTYQTRIIAFFLKPSFDPKSWQQYFPAAEIITMAHPFKKIMYTLWILFAKHCKTTIWFILYSHIIYLFYTILFYIEVALIEFRYCCGHFKDTLFLYPQLMISLNF